MQWFKKSALAAALLFFLPLSAYSADDDGTFTITIQGPEVEDTDTRPVQNRQQNRRQQQTQPAARVSSNQQRQSAQNTPQSSSAPAANKTQSATPAPTVANGTTYKVAAGQSIWSVAHSLVPVDKKVNEFQIIASIYRNNPNAFADHNVNSLIRGSTLFIPSLTEIAKEDASVGAILLKRGSYTLQPLNSNSKSSTGLDLNTEEYTATETRIRELNAQRELQQDDPFVNKNDSRQADMQVPSETANAKKNIDEKLVANDKNVQKSVDAQAISIMLDETKKSIDAKTRQLETQLAQAIERMKKSTAMTAQTSADSVSTLASQYDNIIAGIQQDIIELKGRLSKMSQDNDRMREMLLANDEKLEDIQLQMTQYSVSTADANLELDKPVLMILFGSGLLTLVLIILVIIFKLRTRARQRSLSDEFDFDESVPDDVLLSDADGSIDLESPADGGEDENAEESVNANAVDAPSEDPAKIAQALEAAAAATVQKADSASSEEQKAQEEWDKAASSDSSGADDWAAALNEQAASEKKDEGSQEDMADAWAAALNEQEKGETEEKKEENSQEDMADAWAAALNEQEKGETEEKKEENSQEDMADAWAAALNEQENAEAVSVDVPKEEAPKEELPQDEAVASDKDEKKDEDDLASLLDEGSAEQTKTEDTADAEPSLDEKDLMEAMSSAKEEAAQNPENETLDSADESAAEESADDILASVEQSDAKEESAEIPSEAADLENALNQAKEKNDDSLYTEEISLDEPESSAEETAKEETVKTEPDVVLDENALTQEQSELAAEDMSQEEAVSEDALAADTVLSESDESSLEAVSEEAKAMADALEEMSQSDDSALNDELSDNIADELERRVEESEDEVALAGEAAELAQILDSSSDLENKSEVSEQEIPSSAEDSKELEALMASADENESAMPEEGADEVVSSADAYQSDDVNAVLSSEEEQAMLEALTGSDSKKSAKSGDFTEEDFNIPSADESPSIHEVVEDDLNLEELLDEKASEDNSQPQESENAEAVSWTVPEDDSADEIALDEQSADLAESDSEPSDEEALKELEKRFSMSKEHFDSESESDLMNMLGHSDGELDSIEAEDKIASEDEPFSADDIASMLSTAAVGDESLEAPEEPAQESDPVLSEDADAAQEPSSELETVADRIGPIDESVSEDDSVQETQELSPKEHQYYVDELNLARLYFETGDTEEALKIIDDVKSHGSADLIKEADKVMENYAN